MATQELAALNSATLGTKMPEVTLPDGRKVQTGTVGALIVNIAAYNEAYTQDDQTRMKEYEDKIRAAVPLLQQVGMFDLFTPEEWGRGENQGRKIVAKAWREKFSAE